jgi:hypothetical protein
MQIEFWRRGVAGAPAALSRLEMKNWVACYQRRWFRLLVVSVSMVAEAFHLPLHKALYGAYLVARAELAAAPFPDNDIPAADAWMRRFYTLLKAHHRLEQCLADGDFRPGWNNLG